MEIHGLQKLTLLDYPEKVACTVFLSGCNFRCPFCHNSDLVFNNFDPIMDEKEFYDFLNKRQGLLDGVCITGGEPLIRKGLKEFIKPIKDLGFSVKLDTNGFNLKALKELVDLKLIDYVAVDIKNSKERYNETIGVENFDISLIEDTVSYLLEDNVDYEFRTTVVKEFHDMDSFVEIAKWIKGAKRYYLQPFVNRDSVILQGLSEPSKEELESYAKYLTKYIKNVEIRG